MQPLNPPSLAKWPQSAPIEKKTTSDTKPDGSKKIVLTVIYYFVVTAIAALVLFFKHTGIALGITIPAAVVLYLPPIIHYLKKRSEKVEPAPAVVSNKPSGNRVPIITKGHYEKRYKANV